MAGYQYRLSVDHCATSNFGFAYFLLVNPSGSGRKLTVRSMEVYNHTSFSATASSLILTKNASSDVNIGEPIKDLATPHDSTYSLSGLAVQIYRGGSTPTLYPISSTIATRQTAAAGNHGRLLFGQQSNIGGRRYEGYRNGKMSNSTPIVLNQYESVSLYHKESSGLCNPLRVNMTLSVDGHSFVLDFLSTALPGNNVFSIVNEDDTAIVKLLGFSISDVGTNDTPTLRLVPVGQMYVDDILDTSKALEQCISKMNTTYPTPPSGMKVYRNIGMIPFGVPEVAIADSSPGGTPKNMNYLHTKDFTGPMFRSMLVETAGYRGAGGVTPDNLGHSYGFEQSDWMMRRASLVINPGEGIAVINSCESAITYANFGGWPAFSFGAIISDTPYNVPVISTAGIVVGSTWAIERVSDNSIVAQGTSTDGTINYTYTVEDTPLNLRLKIRKASGAPYYQPYEVAFNLTYAGITLPNVQQELD